MPPGPGAEGGAGLVEATPEEQQLYNLFVGSAMVALYNDETADRMVEAVTGDEDEARGAGEAAAALASRVYSMALEEQADVGGDVILHGLKEIVELVVEVVEASGQTTFTPDMMEGAYYQALDSFADSAREMGTYTDEDAIGDFEALNGLKESGELDAIMQRVMAEQQGAPAEPMPEEAGAPPPPQGGPPMPGGAV